MHVSEVPCGDGVGLLSEAAGHLTRGAPLREAVTSALQACQGLLTSRALAVLLGDEAEGRLEVLASCGVPAESFPALPWPLPADPRSDPAAATRLVAEAAPALGGEAAGLTLVPLGYGDDHLGILLAVHEPGSAPHSQTPTILQGIAGLIALAIRSGAPQESLMARERLERSLQTAHTLQRLLTPSKLPQPDGWRMSVRRSHSIDMGGNFHDMLRLGETRYALAAGEVSGQGEAAGLHLAQVARQLRGGLAASHEPGCVLAEINRMLVEDARRGFLVTMFLAVLDTASGDFAWASAGGTPAGVLDGARASIQWLDGGSDTPMGMLANWDYPEGTGRIEPGGALLAHTAGVNEHVSTAGALLGRDEIEACLGGASGGPAGERLADRVFARLEAQATLQIDGNDFTILAAERME